MKPIRAGANNIAEKPMVIKVEANVGAPQVAYRETLENASEVEYTHKKQSGGAGQFAKVKLLVEPDRKSVV